MLADERLGVSAPSAISASFNRFHGCHAPSSLCPAGYGTYRLLDDPIAAAVLCREVEFWRDHGIYYFGLYFWGSAIAFSRSAENRRAVQQQTWAC
jgi:hypothetical protein